LMITANTTDSLFYVENLKIDAPKR
jgi:hypothetical protein